MVERDELLAFREDLLEKQQKLVHAEDIIHRAEKEKKALEKKRKHETREHTLDETKSSLKRLLTQIKTREGEAHRKLKRCETLLDRENIHNLREFTESHRNSRSARTRRGIVVVFFSERKRRRRRRRQKRHIFQSLLRRCERQLVRANDWFADLQNELESYHFKIDG